jgi:hypothetical protein
MMAKAAAQLETEANNYQKQFELLESAHRNEMTQLEASHSSKISELQEQSSRSINETKLSITEMGKNIDVRNFAKFLANY